MKTIQIENATLQEMFDGIQLIVCSSNQNSKMNEPKMKDILTRKETSILLEVTYQTLNNWAKKKVLIPFSIGSRIYYRKEDILKAMKPIYSIKNKN